MEVLHYVNTNDSAALKFTLILYVVFLPCKKLLW